MPRPIRRPSGLPVAAGLRLGFRSVEANTGPDAHQLDAAAAEIADNAVGVRDPGEDAHGREPRLLRPVEDLDGDIAFAGHLVGKGLPVAGVAHRRRRQHRQVFDADRPGEGGEAPQVDQRRGHTGGIETAGGRDPARQPAHDLFVEEREQSPAEALEHNQAQRIGAEIDHADPARRNGCSDFGHRLSERRASAGRAAAPCPAPTGSDWS